VLPIVVHQELLGAERAAPGEAPPVGGVSVPLCAMQAMTFNARNAMVGPKVSIRGKARLSVSACSGESADKETV
jgi:hypothetical protein